MFTPSPQKWLDVMATPVTPTKNVLVAIPYFLMGVVLRLRCTNVTNLAFRRSGGGEGTPRYKAGGPVRASPQTDCP